MYSPPRFTEENQAGSTYALTALAIALLGADHLIQLTAGPHSRGSYILALIVAMVAASSAVYCVMGCIWHPIPKEFRATAGMTSLQLDSAEAANRSRFIPDDIAATVDASQTEVRPRIQWTKMFLVLGTVGLMFCLTVLWNH